MWDDWAAWWSSQNLPAIEWAAAGLSLVYVVLAARASPWCWPFAFVGSLLWAYQVLAVYALWFDTGLNLFYAAMALVGAWRWWRADRALPATGARDEYAMETRESAALPIRAMTTGEHAWMLLGSAVATGALYVLAKAYLPAALPGLDAATTVVSVGATVLLIERRLENWLYLLAADLVYVYIYLERGSAIFAAMFVLYSVMAVVGYRAWRRQARDISAGVESA